MCRQRSDVGCKCKFKFIMKWFIGLNCKLLIKKHTTRKWNFNVFEPNSMIMDSECSPEAVCDHGDFHFAFNDSNFSDRVLRIYMSSDQPFESTQSPSAERVETLHISSQVLAARSPFFYKLFSNGMRESQQSDVTLRINASEELAFMELLNFMYNNNLTVTNASDVLDVLITANKYDVPSCMRHCSRLLKNLSMTPESVLVYLDLPSTVLTSEAFLPLTVAARQFYVVHYKDMTKIKYEDIVSLPLAGVEAILASDDLQVICEDFVYVFVHKWAKTHFPNLIDRRAIMATRLAKYIRYPFMSHIRLMKLLTNNNFDKKFAQKVVTEAISFKAEVPHTTYIRDKNSVLNRWFVERAYKYRPIKIVEFEEPRPHCVVYLDLKHDVCANLFPSDSVISEEFSFGGRRFFLLAKRKIDCFGFFLATMKEESCSFVFEFVVATRSKPAEEFVAIFKSITTCTSGKTFGKRNVFSIPWSRFIGEDSVYFIDGVLHIKVQLTKLSD